jgi:hypothetical protein
MTDSNLPSNVYILEEDENESAINKTRVTDKLLNDRAYS